MTTRRFRFVAAGMTVTVAIVGLVVRNQVNVYRGRQAPAALILSLHDALPISCWASISRTYIRDVDAASASIEAPLMKVRRAIMSLSVVELKTEAQPRWCINFRPRTLVPSP